MDPHAAGAMSKALFIFGTRPEAIKLAPLVRALQGPGGAAQVEVCVTAQHRQMLDQVLGFFEIVPQHDLDLMTAGQSLFHVTGQGILGLQAVLEASRPDLIFVQGDTTTTFLGALAGYYTRTPVAHLEAGLRSGDKSSPYPEELNRQLTGRLADLHFAPTERARRNLQAEGIRERVWVVGNTVVDALLAGLGILRQQGDAAYLRRFAGLRLGGRLLLVTGHRRESFGAPLEQICRALLELAGLFPDLQIVYPVHLTPNVREPVTRLLGQSPRIHLLEPLTYPELLWLMDRCTLVLTDSGGIQEEAPSLGKPVLVTREVTERVEGIEAGTARLVGRDRQKIVDEVGRLLTDPAAYAYGDGQTCQRILQILRDEGRL